MRAALAPCDAQLRPADLALRRVVSCHLTGHARPGVTWSALEGEASLHITVDDHAFVLPLSCAKRELGLDAALRQLEAWKVLRQ